ncbi:hypothetical protein [Microbacterium sp. p3-SID336]|uniref:hypothetical protein n=1 Tax=Microbacterium sp. p3-SID336 TaxID=2916212 RepID=UPI0021A735C8|nr:hypothetical protein [Microbacterium sp. p3-SID336]MCT1478395.1 hypothetical protein [Microbacterium sp. p3-SID336]
MSFSERGHLVSRIVAVCAVVLAITACTPQAQEETPRPSITATSGPQLPGEEPGVVGATKLPSDIPNSPAVRSAAKITSCAASDGGWTAAGTVTNPTEDDASYVVTVFFTNSAATVVGSGQATVEVDGGATTDWSVTSDFVAPNETLCALRGVG